MQTHSFTASSISCLRYFRQVNGSLLPDRKSQEPGLLAAETPEENNVDERFFILPR